MADPNGRIAGGAAKLAETLKGKWSTFVGEVDLLWVALGDNWLAEMKRMTNIGIAFVRVTRNNLGTLKDAFNQDMASVEDEQETIWTKIRDVIVSRFKEGIQKNEEIAKGFAKNVLPNTVAVLQDLGNEFDRVLAELESKQEKLGTLTPRGVKLPPIKQGIPLDKEQIFQANIELDATAKKLLNAESAAAQLENTMKGVAAQLGAAFRNSNNLAESLLRAGLAFAAQKLSGPLGIGASFLSAAFKHGGSGTMGSSGALRGAQGLSGMVPQGFPGDSFPILVSTGERVNVETKAQAGATDKVNSRILGSLNALNANVSLIGQRQDVIEASINVDDRGLQLLVEKSEMRDGTLR